MTRDVVDRSHNISTIHWFFEGMDPSSFIVCMSVTICLFYTINIIPMLHPILMVKPIPMQWWNPYP